MSEKSENLTYQKAGVHLTEKDSVIEQFFHLMRRTYDPRVIEIPWGFAGFFSLNSSRKKVLYKSPRHPVLVSCADGVGTKLRLAALARQYDTVGIDLVAMNVNDLIVHGAQPLFFLDYIAFNHLEKETLLKVFQGISEGCRQAGCALLGGETAEMPGFFQAHSFELSGFCVGMVDKAKMVTGSSIRPGDLLIGLASSGPHSNGYSLIRKILFKDGEESAADPAVAQTLPTLLTPTRIYVKSVLALLSRYPVKRVIKGMAHITGGGIQENLVRILPSNTKAVIQKGSWPTPPIFSFLQERGGVSEEEMFRVFNMGIGFILVVAPFYARAIMRFLKRRGENLYPIGTIEAGDQSVEIRDP